MARYEATPSPVARVDVADVFSSAALDIREDSATTTARQGCTSRHAVVWLARRGRISLEHAAALAEANKLGGAA
jgi:hypothetical protein